MSFFISTEPLLQETGAALLLENGGVILLEQETTLVVVEDGIDAFEKQASEDAKRITKELIDAQYFDLTLFANTHFGPDGTGDFPDPGSFEITEKAGEFEIRTPL